LELAQPPYVGVSCRLSLMSACVCSVVKVRWHGSCDLLTHCVLSKLKCFRGVSPGCSEVWLKSTERASTRGGVPVFRRSVSNPMRTSCSAKPLEGFSPARPASVASRPTQMTPFKKVPAVSTIERARHSSPASVTMPQAVLLLLSRSKSVAWPSASSTFGAFST